MSSTQQRGPLTGFRVLELGQLIAGPFTGSILGYFGAEVIKVEPPGRGDPIRQWRVVRNDTSLWWHSVGRNKLSVTIDLKSEQGRDLVRKLVAHCDVLVENFRPGVMEDWGLGPEDLADINPDLIYTRISGYGQTGPYAHKPGYASVCEGFSGFRYVNGFPGEAPVRPNLSIGDTIAALHAALGVAMALVSRLNKRSGGQTVDVAIYESMFNLMEAVVPEYTGAGVMREPSGTTVTGIVPTNTYRCGDGKYVVIGGNGDSIFKRLMVAAGRSDMANDPRLAHNPGRVEHEQEIDTALSHWCAGLGMQQVIDILEAERVPVGPIYNVADMLDDPQYNARDMFEHHTVEGGLKVSIPAMVPKLSATPGATQWTGPAVGAHTDSVLQRLLGLDATGLSGLREAGVI